jgi:hypothetical protein
MYWIIAVVAIVVFAKVAWDSTEDRELIEELRF